MKRIEIKSYRIRAEKKVDGYQDEDMPIRRAQHNVDIMVNANNLDDAIEKATLYLDDDKYEIVCIELEDNYITTPF